MSTDRTDQPVASDLDKEFFQDMVTRFGDRAWPPVKILAGLCRITQRQMNQRLARFAALGWIGSGPQEGGPWVGEVVPPSEDEPRRRVAGLPVGELEQRLRVLREEREQAAKDGRPYDGSAAIAKLDPQ